MSFVQTLRRESIAVGIALPLFTLPNESQAATFNIPVSEDAGVIDGGGQYRDGIIFSERDTGEAAGLTWLSLMKFDLSPLRTCVVHSAYLELVSNYGHSISTHYHDVYSSSDDSWHSSTVDGMNRPANNTLTHLDWVDIGGFIGNHADMTHEWNVLDGVVGPHGLGSIDNTLTLLIGSDIFQPGPTGAPSGFGIHFYDDTSGLNHPRLIVDATCPSEIQVHDGGTELFDNQPNPVMVGDLLPGETTTHPITVTNAGLLPLDITSVVLVDDGGGSFSISGLPTFLAAGEWATLDVTFTPNSNGSRSGLIQIFNSDPNNSPFEVPLIGRADNDADGVRDGSDLCPGNLDGDDGDGDGLPDGCDFLLSASPLGGRQITLSVDRAPAAQTVYFLASAVGTQATWCVPQPQTACIDLDRRSLRVIGSATTNQVGHAEITVNAPPPGLQVWVQAGFLGDPMGDATQVLPLP